MLWATHKLRPPEGGNPWTWPECAASFDGTLGPEAGERPPLTDDELDAITRRAVMRVYAHEHAPPPLDRLPPEEPARYRP